MLQPLIDSDDDINYLRYFLSLQLYCISKSSGLNLASSLNTSTLLGDGFRSKSFIDFNGGSFNGDTSFAIGTLSCIISSCNIDMASFRNSKCLFASSVPVNFTTFLWYVMPWLMKDLMLRSLVSKWSV